MSAAGQSASSSPSPSPSTRTYSLRPKPRRVRNTLLAVLLLVVAAHVGWGLRARRQLTRQIESLRRAGEPTCPVDLFQVAPVADADNAALDLRRASLSLHRSHPAWKRWREFDFGTEGRALPPLSEAELACAREIVQVEDDALALAAAAVEKPCAYWPVSLRSPMFLTRFPDLSTQGDLSELLRIAALAAAEGGDHAQAVERLRQALRVAEATETVASYAHLVAVERFADAAHVAADLAPGLGVEGHGPPGGAASRAQVRRLIDALLDDAGARLGQRFCLRALRVEQLDGFTALADGRVQLDDLVHVNPAEGSGRAWRVVRPLVRPMILHDADVVCRLMTRVVEAGGEETWPGFAAKAPDVDAEVRSGSPPHLFAPLLVDDYRRAARSHYRCLADRRMAAVALAVRWYTLDHGGRRPAALGELVPEYLPFVPMDPLAAGTRQLGYRPDPAPPVVYSVGDDGVDNGGSDLLIPWGVFPAHGDPEDLVLYLDGRRSTEVPASLVPPPFWFPQALFHGTR